MDILQTILIVLFSIFSAILIFLVLIQSGKGGGLNLVGGGNTGMQPATMDVVTKITWVVGTIFFVLAILAAVAFADAGPGKLDEKPVTNDADLPIDTTKPASKSTPQADTKTPVSKDQPK